MHPDVERILFSEKEIEDRTRELGEEISAYYDGQDVVVVGLLKGSIPFMAELVKRISVDIELDFMDVSSYAGKKSTEVKVNKDIACSVSGKKVLIVEDIVDTGKTLKVVKEMFYTKGADEVKIVTLLDKPEGRLVEIEPDWCGFITPNEFVIGYGLDYNQKYRNLPYVGVIKPSAI